MNSTTSTTRLKLNIGFDPNNWFLFFVQPRIEINGKEFKVKWGVRYFELPPGPYKIRAFYPYLYEYYSAIDTLTVELREGQTLHVKYNATHRLRQGKLSLEEETSKYII